MIILCTFKLINVKHIIINYDVKLIKQVSLQNTKILNTNIKKYNSDLDEGL